MIFTRNYFVATMAILVLTTTTAFTQTPGSLDGTFGSGGVATTFVATTDNNLSPGKGAVQSDGKILALADAHLNTGNSFTNVVIRYNLNGTLDAGFGSGGFLYMNWNGANDAFGNAYAITTQIVGADEKIIVAGSAASGGLRVDRYNSDGSADTSFGTNGIALLSNGGYALAVAVQSDGKVLTMGDVGTLVRLNANGTPDTTFGNGGIVQSSAVKTRSLAVQSSGRIIACGYSSVKGKNVLTVARFSTTGALDTSFGTGGKTVVDFFGGGSGGSDVKVDGVGRILAAGGASRKNSTNGDFAVARLTASGQLDSTFDSDGKATVDFGGFGDNAQSIDIQSNGLIVLTGETNSTSTNKNSGIARLNSTGTLELTFGQNGRVVTDLSSANEYTRKGMIQFDVICGCEKLITIGTAENGSIDYAIAARYLLL